jgi:sugar phosphate isomerase/epimerase
MNRIAGDEFQPTPMAMNPHQPFRRREFIRMASVLSLSLNASAPSFGAESLAPYQIGIYTRPWDRYDYRVALDGMVDAGFRYAGLMTAKGKSGEIVSLDSTPEEIAEIAAELQKRKLVAISIYAGAFPVDRSINDGIAGLRKLIDYAVICKCPNLLLGGTTEETLVEPYYKVVAECCDYAATEGVGLTVKPHGGQNATGPQCRKLIARVNHKNFRLWYDPGNIYYYSNGALDPVEDCAAVDGLVAGMSVKDFKLPKEVLVTPGTGLVKFREVLARLRRGGFASGPLVIECLDPGTSPAHVTAQARKAREFVEKLIGGD